MLLHSLSVLKRTFSQVLTAVNLRHLVDKSETPGSDRYLQKVPNIHMNAAFYTFLHIQCKVLYSL